MDARHSLERGSDHRMTNFARANRAVFPQRANHHPFRPSHNSFKALLIGPWPFSLAEQQAGPHDMDGGKSQSSYNSL